MEKNEISLHEVKVYMAVRALPGKWLTNHEIASSIEGVTERTVRAHTRKLVNMGIFDQAEVFPAHRYRWAEKASKRNASYSLRLETASDVFGFIKSAEAG